MSRNQMQHAQQLIKQGRYDEARKILRTVDHPKAREWLAKLDKRAPARPKRRRTGSGIGGRIVSFLTYLLTILLSAAATIGVLAGLVVSTASTRSAAQQQALEATAIAEMPTATATRPARTGVVISTQNINVRSGPNTDSGAIARLIPGTTVEIQGENDDGTWFQIRLPDGTLGWVAANLLDAEPAPTAVAGAETTEPDMAATSGDTCAPNVAQAWYDAQRQLIFEARFTMLQTESVQVSGKALDYEQFSQTVRENRAALDEADYPPCLEDVRTALLVGFQALDNSYQNRLRGFPNEAASEFNIARTQFAAAETRLTEELGVEAHAIACGDAEIWYAGIEDDVTAYLSTIENISLDTRPSAEIRAAIFDLQEIRDRLDIAAPDCAVTASEHLKESVTAAVRLFQAIMAEDTPANKQTQLATMVAEATNFLNEMRKLGITIA